jgi:DNA replication protein DnaC
MPDLQLVRLQDQLGKLKLFTLQTRLETLLQEASAQEVTYADFLDRLLAEELAAKSEKYVAMRTVMARFPYRKTMGKLRFQFSARARSQEAAGVGHRSVHRARGQ